MSTLTSLVRAVVVVHPRKPSNRPAKIVDYSSVNNVGIVRRLLTIGHGRSSLGGPVIAHLLGERALTPAEKEEAVWIDIDNAFSRPVTASDDQADYAPTQILAELFRSAGYDAIGYRSQFGDDGERRGYNIAIFDPEAVDVVSCAPYEVHSIKIVAVENGAAWYRSE